MSTTAAGTGKPVRTMRWLVWSRPPTNGLTPRRSRVTVTRVVSKIGTPITRIGTRNVVLVGAVEAQLHPEVRQHEPEEERAGVSHVDPRRMEVVAEEAERAARESRSAKPGDQELPVLRGDHEDRTGRDRRDTRRQPVHVVEEVERVRDADHPQRP